MLDSFVLVLTLCGSLHTGGHACEDFVIDTEQTEISCLRSIETIHNHEKTPLYVVMGDAQNDWFKTVKSEKLTCVIEDKE